MSIRDLQVSDQELLKFWKVVVLIANMLLRNGGYWIFWLKNTAWEVDLSSSTRVTSSFVTSSTLRSEPLDLSCANDHGEVRGSSWSYLVPYTVVFLSGRCCWIDGDRSMDYCHYHLPAPPCHSISHLSFFWFFLLCLLWSKWSEESRGHIERHTGEKSFWLLIPSSN